MRSYDTRNVRVSAVFDGITKELVFRSVSFALRLMFNLISKSRVRKTGFKILKKNDETDSSIGIRRILRRESAGNPIVFDEAPGALDEAERAVQLARMALISAIEHWHNMLWDVSSAKIRACQEMVVGLSQTSSNDDRARKPRLLPNVRKRPRHELETCSRIGPLDRVYSDAVGSFLPCSAGVGRIFCGTVR